MLVRELQQQLTAFYETPLEHCVTDFLVTDARLARALEGNGAPVEGEERLLLKPSHDGLDVSLYIDARILDALDENDPYESLTEGNLNDFLVALEGVSHFNYVIWNASHEKLVTQLELELQAEVDKFVTACMLFALQGEHGALDDFHDALFTRIRFDPALGAREEERYRDANRYAAKYCHALTRRYGNRHRHDEPSFVNELRRFYRLPAQEKIRRIETARA